MALCFSLVVIVFPTYVGINRPYLVKVYRLKRVPHIRGDKPFVSLLVFDNL